MEILLIVVLVVAGAIVFRVWEKRWHEQHGGDRRNDTYDTFDGSGFG